jgi:hypothetical protein
VHRQFPIIGHRKNAAKFECIEIIFFTASLDQEMKMTMTMMISEKTMMMMTTIIVLMMMMMMVV